MPREPVVSIYADGSDITGGLSSVLLSVTVNDNDGEKSDSVTIAVDNKDEQVSPPRRGAELAVKMGYRETGLVDMGTYVVDRVRTRLWPRTYTIEAKSADFEKGSSKGMTKKKQWEDKDLKTILTDVAGQMGVGLEIGSLGSVKVRYEAMTEESPVHFAQRLAKDHKAVLKINSGKMIFLTKKEAANRQSTVTISLTDLLDLEADVSERTSYRNVKTSYYDRAKSERVEVAVGMDDEGPDYEVRQSYETKEEAEAAAKGKKDELERGKGDLSATLEGTPAIMSGVNLVLAGVQSDVDGEWNCRTVTHSYSRGPSFRTRLTADKEPEE